jgi:hypothetical protein
MRSLRFRTSTRKAPSPAPGSRKVVVKLSQASLMEGKESIRLTMWEGVNTSPWLRTLFRLLISFSEDVSEATSHSFAIDFITEPFPDNRTPFRVLYSLFLKFAR